MTEKSHDPVSKRGIAHPPQDGDVRSKCDDIDPDVDGSSATMPPPKAKPPNKPGSVQRLLEKEGHDARNVVSWLVPNRTGGGAAEARKRRTYRRRVRPTLDSTRSGFLVDTRTGSSTRQRNEPGERGSRETSRERDHDRRKSPITSPFKSSNGSASSSKGTPSWRGRGSDSTALGFNQRLWGYLFRNVNRAVDELYYLCEAEGSATHCREAAELLESCMRDFNKLVERIADQRRFEEEQRAARAAENIGQEREGESLLETGRRPKGLVWEVRKTTSAAGASAIVLSAIERMESQSHNHPCLSTPATTATSSPSPKDLQAVHDTCRPARPSASLNHESDRRRAYSAEVCTKHNDQSNSEDVTASVRSAPGRLAAAEKNSGPVGNNAPGNASGLLPEAAAAVNHTSGNDSQRSEAVAYVANSEAREKATTTQHATGRKNEDKVGITDIGGGDAAATVNDGSGDPREAASTSSSSKGRSSDPPMGKASRLNPRAAPFMYIAPSIEPSDGGAKSTGIDNSSATSINSTSKDDKVVSSAKSIQHVPEAAGSGANAAIKVQDSPIVSFEDETKSSTIATAKPVYPPETRPEARRANESSLVSPVVGSLQSTNRTQGNKKIARTESQTTAPRSVKGIPESTLGVADAPKGSSGSVMAKSAQGYEEAQERQPTGGRLAHYKSLILPPESKWSRRPKLTPDRPREHLGASSGPKSPATIGASTAAPPSRIAKQNKISCPLTGPGLVTVPSTRPKSAPTQTSDAKDQHARGTAPIAKGRSAERCAEHDGVRFANSGGRKKGAVLNGNGIEAESQRSSARRSNGGVSNGNVIRTKDRRAGTKTGEDSDPTHRNGAGPERDGGKVEVGLDTASEFLTGDIAGKGGDSVDGDGSRAARYISDCCDEADADSAYVTAMEQIWAEAEALVDAEAQAEEEAWARLPTDVPCPPESEEIPSDAEEACRVLSGAPCGPSLSGAEAGAVVESSPRGEQLHHTDLEIEIPTCDEEAIASVNAGAATAEGTEEALPGGSQSMAAWYREVESDHDRGGACTDDYDDDDDDDDDEEMDDGNEEDEKKKGRLMQDDRGACTSGSGGGERGWHAPASLGSSCPAAREGKGRDPSSMNPSASGGSSGASNFANDRGSYDTSDDGWVPFAHRELQKKLSSPQRKPQRKLLSAAEAKRRQERRQMVAELNRAQLASGMAEKLKQHEERARGVRFRKEEQILKAEEEARRKMEGADARRREHRRGIVRKANDANSKVEEVLFMNKLTVEDLKITLQMKLVEVDRRIQSGRERRQQLLAGISDRQRKRTKDKAAQMSERRLEAESAAAMRWEALQKRLEAVQERRRDRARETRRRMQAADRHHQARERREAMLQSCTIGRQKADISITGSRRRQKSSLRTRTATDGKDPDFAIIEGLDSDQVHRTNAKDGAKESQSSNANALSLGDDLSPVVTRAPNGCSFQNGNKSVNGLKGTGLNDAQSARRGRDKLSSIIMREDASISPSADKSGVGSIVPPIKTPLIPPAPPPPEKRGRAQKKRARKLKEKMKQLCLDFAARGMAEKTAAGGTRGSHADSDFPAVPMEMHGLQATVQEGCKSTTARDADREKMTFSLWTRLDKMALDLSALESARAHHQRHKALAGVEENARAATANNSAARRSSSTLAEEDTTGGEMDPIVPKSPQDLISVSETASVVDGKASASATRSSQAFSERRADDDARVKCDPRRCTGNVVAQGEPDDLDVKSSVSLRSEEYLVKKPGVADAQRDVFPQAEAESASATSSHSSRAQCSKQEGIAPEVEGQVALVANLAAPAQGHRKTRRGKRAGGAINRRRSAKERAAGREGKAASNANVLTSAPPGDALRDTAIGTVDDIKAEAAFETSRACYFASLCSLGQPANDKGDVDGQVDRPMTREVHQMSHKAKGASTITTSPSAVKAMTTDSVSTDVPLSAPFCTANCGTLLNRYATLPLLPALEEAAVRSLRDLRAMLSSATSNTEKTSGKKERRRTPSNSPPPVISGASSPSGSLLQEHLRHRGILESLVALCAPFPWSPVVTAGPADDSYLETQRPSSSLPRSPDEMFSTTPSKQPDGSLKGIPQHNAALCAPVSGSTSSHTSGFPHTAGKVRVTLDSSKVNDDRNTFPTKKRENAVQMSLPTQTSRPATPPRKEVGKRTTGRGGSGGGVTAVDCANRRESLIESALEVLGEALKDTDNREHVLRVDGAAPLVDCLSRLLERALMRRDENALSSPPRHKETPGPADKSNGSGLYESSESCSGNRRVRGRVSTDSGGPCTEQIMGIYARKENALRTGSSVIALLLRHVPLGDSCARIQEEFSRYLLAKRILTDSSYLVSFLRGKMCRIGALPAKKAPDPTLTPHPRSPTNQRKESLPTPHVTRGTAGSQSPFVGLVDSIVDLVNAVVTLPMVAIRPARLDRGWGGVGGCQPGACCLPEPELADVAETKSGDRSSSPRCGRHVDRSDGGYRAGASTTKAGVKSRSVAGGGGLAADDAIGEGGVGDRTESETAKPPAVCCRRQGNLSDGTLAIRRGLAHSTFMPGGARVIAAFVSLLASVAGSEERTGESRVKRAVRTKDANGRVSASGSTRTAPASDGFLELASKVVQTINQACLIDLSMVQECLSVEGVRLEFAFLCDHLLATIADRLHVQGSESPVGSPTQPEMWLDRVVRLLVFFCLGNRKNQEILQWGPPPTILVRLCNLPFRYFSEARYQDVLFPTLIAICYQNVRNRDVAENDLATVVFSDFLRRHLKDSDAKISATDKGLERRESISEAREPTAAGVLLSQRLPLEMWEGAIAFFTPPS